MLRFKRFEGQTHYIGLRGYHDLRFYIVGFFMGKIEKIKNKVAEKWIKPRIVKMGGKFDNMMKGGSWNIKIHCRIY